MNNTSMTQRVQRMIAAGYTNQQIISKLQVKPQIVYNIRYKMGKKKGLGALPIKTTTPTPAPAGEKLPTLWEKFVSLFK